MSGYRKVKPKRHRTQWLPTEDALLLSLAAIHTPARAMADMFGREVPAVQSRLVKLRNRPIDVMAQPLNCQSRAGVRDHDKRFVDAMFRAGYGDLYIGDRL